MIYDVTIQGLSDYPGWDHITTRDAGELARYRRKAAEKARMAKQEWERDNDGDHLVYYYELPKRKRTQPVVVLMTPQAVTDEFFQRFVNGFKPEYVGAIHKKKYPPVTLDLMASSQSAVGDEATDEGRGENNKPE